MITKVSEITTDYLAEYLRLGEIDNTEKNYLLTILNIAKSYVKNYTGIDDIDKHTEFVYAVCVICQDLYDNRSLYVDSSNINKVLESILRLHSINLL